MEVLIIDVKEPKEIVQRKLQDRFNFTFPLLLDTEGIVAASYAPDGVLPDMRRPQMLFFQTIAI